MSILYSPKEGNCLSGHPITPLPVVWLVVLERVLFFFFCLILLTNHLRVAPDLPTTYIIMGIV